MPASWESELSSIRCQENVILYDANLTAQALDGQSRKASVFGSKGFAYDDVRQIKWRVLLEKVSDEENSSIHVGVTDDVYAMSSRRAWTFANGKTRQPAAADRWLKVRDMPEWTSGDILTVILDLTCDPPLLGLEMEVFGFSHRIVLENIGYPIYPFFYLNNAQALTLLPS